LRGRDLDKTVSSELIEIQQCLRDVEEAVFNRDGKKLLKDLCELENLINSLKMKDDVGIEEDVVSYYHMKAACRGIMTRLDTVTKHANQLVSLARKASEDMVGYGSGLYESRVVQGLDVIG
jgi:hypothetical protein